MWKLLITVLAAAVLIGCGATPLGPIEAEQSMLRVGLSAYEWPTITRDLTEVQERRTEVWDWPSGSLRLVQTRRRRYIDQDFADPEDLIESIDLWPTFARTDISADSIKRGENAIGIFHFATAEKRERRCFYMLQGIPEFRPPGTMPVGGTEVSDGYIRFYHCASRGTVTEGELEARGLAFANSLSRNW